MDASDFVKKPCAHCPFRTDVRPFLRPARAEEIAYAAQNPYSEFFCHKTVEFDDEGESVVGGARLICAGFLTMQINEAGIKCPDGFTPAENVYSDPSEMIFACEDEENGRWQP